MNENKPRWHLDTPSWTMAHDLKYIEREPCHDLHHLSFDMTRTQQLRRASILCLHFLRNRAFYKAGWRKRELIAKNQFLVNANSNSLDICVLEWCKLFGEKKGRHYWGKVITDREAFFVSLLQFLKLTEPEFEDYVDAMRTYRDKFIAHLDSDEVMLPPKLRVARKSVSFFYDYMLTHEEVDDCFYDAPKKVSRLYKEFLSIGRKAYLK